jgi:hypothetical protein
MFRTSSSTPAYNSTNQSVNSNIQSTYLQTCPTHSAKTSLPRPARRLYVSFILVLSLSTNAAQQPQSSKSTLTKAKESLTGTGDKLARETQPDHSKTNTQSVGDKFGRSKDNSVHGSTGGSIVDKTKNALGMGHTTGTHSTHHTGGGL